MTKFEVALQDKLLLDINEVAAIMGIGRDLVYRLVLDIDPGTLKPRLHSVKIGRRRLVARTSLERFILQEVNV